MIFYIHLGIPHNAGVEHVIPLFAKRRSQAQNVTKCRYIL